MSPPKVMSGARAKVGFVDPATNEVVFVGIFNNVSYGVAYDAQPAYILGRYSPAEIDYTAAEPVNISASGWRVFKHGPHVAGRLPKLQDLHKHEYLMFVILDRQNPTEPIARIKKVRPTGTSTTLSARQLQEMSLTYTGILVDDESTENDEAAGSMDLP